VRRRELRRRQRPTSKSFMAQALRERLIGAWKLVSYVEKPVDGSAPYCPMGEEPQGIIMYTSDAW
jgi:hypothetical protein